MFIHWLVHSLNSTFICKKLDSFVSEGNLQVCSLASLFAFLFIHSFVCLFIHSCNVAAVGH